jgi:hypothetical protein
MAKRATRSGGALPWAEGTSTVSLVSLKSLLGDAQAASSERARIAAADVIIGVDAGSLREFTVFGTPALEESFLAGRPVAMRTVSVEIDQQAGDLEKLVALVRSIKGRRDSISPSDP